LSGWQFPNVRQNGSPRKKIYERHPEASLLPRAVFGRLCPLGGGCDDRSDTCKADGAGHDCCSHRDPTR
jgi:hypothetical protein